MKREDVANQRKSEEYCIALLSWEEDDQGWEENHGTVLEQEVALQCTDWFSGFSGSKTIESESEEDVDDEDNTREDQEREVIWLAGKDESDDWERKVEHIPRDSDTNHFNICAS